MRFMVVTSACLMLAAAAGAQTIPLHTGETITVRLEQGNAVVERRAPAEPIGEHEKFMIRQAQMETMPSGATTAPPKFLQRGDVSSGPPTPVAGRVQLTFRRVPGLELGSSDHSVLILANGYGSTFGYRAILHVNRRSAPTDVCEVPPQMRGVEHWAYVIDQLDLSELRLAHATNEIRCQ